MNSIFWGREHVFATACRVATIIILVVILCVIPSVGRLHAQTGGDPAAEFKSIAAELSAARLGGADESEARMEKALEYLDSFAVSALNGSASPDLEAANRRLAGLAAHTPPVGENYRLVKLGGTPAAYAMVINFGSADPAAVRIYAGAAGHYALAAKDRSFCAKGFFR